MEIDMRKIVALTLILLICVMIISCSESKQNLILEEELLSYSKEKLNIDERYYDTSYSSTRFYICYMFNSHNSSKYTLFERPGDKNEGYLLLDEGDVICDQYGIDFKKYGDERKIVMLLDENSECSKILLECRANRKNVTTFEIEVPLCMVIDLDEWGDKEKVDYISFRKADDTIIREERVL